MYALVGQQVVYIKQIARMPAIQHGHQFAGVNLIWIQNSDPMSGLGECRRRRVVKSRLPGCKDSSAHDLIHLDSHINAMLSDKQLPLAS